MFLRALHNQDIEAQERVKCHEVKSNSYPQSRDKEWNFQRDGGLPAWIGGNFIAYHQSSPIGKNNAHERFNRYDNHAFDMQFDRVVYGEFQNVGIDV